MTSKWRLAARKAIESAIASVEDSKDLVKIKKAIDAAYPFHRRECFPYKVWLSERKKYFYQLGILQKPPDKGGRRNEGRDRTSPGQMSLFD
ncbi:hypothetical protein H6G54_12100 [Anabaena cylindrica FACHB-243]|uniref:Uncharacterized protein n=1 Tax=Anabaena cylindrica (strain ATCC 27899 / PCC 7122) TaxID=272123 RepID=K9ZE84_ANACC|nr:MULTISPECIES: hypothetical protein [Anabaena]AFZ56907.1 hypothetical protein Anacy_1396 [Anabaena cylindrica PCC 7122]MBD2418425.1 hypothetical protein [Anabaena cylindrica FACHB-243]MBY5284373.1 hypothetical protein [Anabaena sp. CCAP 1446/1C]MBY5307648.1 hypothetical protein [Anabaena sp. CCAP 1446/1C]MCM2409392.1 hypothetical protein [Anabaena sp. CCAP 1446/1C]